MGRVVTGCVDPSYVAATGKAYGGNRLDSASVRTFLGQFVTLP